MIIRTGYNQIAHLFVLVLILLSIAASRAYRLDVNHTEVQVDEAWSVWQTYGTPEQIIRWTPYDWTPLYYLTLGGWRELAGLHPVVLRWLSVLCALIGAAALYRVGRRLGGQQAGMLSTLLFMAFTYVIFLSTELRGYALALALYPLALWGMLRYLALPSLRRMIMPAVAMAALFYTTLTAVPALLTLVLFTLIAYGWRKGVLRWWLPGGLAALLALPEIINKAGMFTRRLDGTASIILPPLPEALVQMVEAWSAHLLPLWAALLALALIMLALRPPDRRMAVSLLVWALLPVPLYFTNHWHGFFNMRYMWWVLIGLALLMSMGLARLPRRVAGALALIAALAAFMPVSFAPYQIFTARIGQAYAWLAGHAQAGDVIVVDPLCACASFDTLDYYTRVYLPDRVHYADAPHNARRVWYVTGAAGPSPELRAQIEQGRRAERFFGAPEGLFRLYEAPPHPIGMLYDNGMRFHGIELLDRAGYPVWHEGVDVNFRLWWSADFAPALDYSVGVLLLDDAGNVIAQDDSAPQLVQSEWESVALPTNTSAWLPDYFYVETRSLRLPYPLQRGTYRLMLAVYWFGDQQRVSAPDVAETGLLHLLDVPVVSWGH